jgi:predicted ribosomally synthesized peptide with SipW-like signal peptide
MSDNEDSGFDLTRRKVLGGLVGVGAASAAAGAGTMALFSDTESSTDNVIQAGTLDLKPDGDGVKDGVTVEDVKPTDSGAWKVPLNNDGSLPGYLRVTVDLTDNKENGLTDPESEVDDSGGDPGAGNGELAEAVDAEIGFDGTGDDAIDTSLADADLIGVSGLTGATFSADYELTASGGADPDTTFVFDWSVPESVGNAIQSDSFTVDFTFELGQKPASADVTLTGDSAAFASGENPLLTSTDAKWGSGSWRNDSGKHGRLYFAGQFSDFHSLPEFTVDEIDEIRYHTKKSQSYSDETSDFFLLIYTTTDSVSNPDDWYGRRLTALPHEAASRDAPAGQWNEWSTASGTNQLQFYDSARQASSDGNLYTLQEIQSGSVSWDGGSESEDYGPQTVKTLAVAADNVSFDSRIDAVKLSLTTGDTLVVDLEP